MTKETKHIIESENFIVLNTYNAKSKTKQSYQSEDDLECELIDDLKEQGYEFSPHIKSIKTMLANIREQLQKLNNVKFTNDEWERFVQNYLNKPGDGSIEKTRKIQDDYIHDFIFDSGLIKNISLLDKDNIMNNKVEVIKQFEQTGIHSNRYDVTILVNGLPLVQVELKKRGVAIREAFNQIHRYSKESFNSENSLYKYLQLFVISNGTDTRYFPNTVKRDKNSFDFTMNWANSDNLSIKDLKDFTATFFQKKTLLTILLDYSVFDTDNNLLIMRPYQIAATERILWKINSSYETKKWKSVQNGGFIWHTTGSGKTLTSFKAAQMATKLSFINKVFFVVDRKDLDYQTMKEYQRFSPNSVNGSNNTNRLKENIIKNDNKIVVTTIQKLHSLMKRSEELDIYNKQVVFIFDECHRSQFGEVQKLLKIKFKKYYQFGFTGTPISNENSVKGQTTNDVFGCNLHSYLITDAIRDEKVLKFKVDYTNVSPKSEQFEMEQDEDKLNSHEYKKALLHQNRIDKVSQYVLDKFPQKTHRLYSSNKGFNAMFAVSSIEAAKKYYESLNKLQQNSEKPLKIATIFSYADNEKQDAKGDIPDESFEVDSMNYSNKEFLGKVIKDYNESFKTSFVVNNTEFQNYYRDLAMRFKSKEIDLLIVIGMFLTGFDAPHMNTMFIDKNLRYHGLLQTYSRTNRILNSTKRFGNIIAFRDLEKATIDAITLFGDKQTTNTAGIVIEKSYKEYMEGFEDILTGMKIRGFVDIIADLEQNFPDPNDIDKESDKKNFIKLFSEYLRIENVLKNYDEFSNLNKLQKIDVNDAQALKEFKEANNLSDKDLTLLQAFKIPSERKIQDYKSCYNDIRDWIKNEKDSNKIEKSTIDWSDIVFEVDLLKSQEINLDYILEQIYENSKKTKDKQSLIKDIRRLIRASINNRTKEELIIDFITQIDINTINEKTGIIESFYSFAQSEKKREVYELINDEDLNNEDAKRYIAFSLKRGNASYNGTDLNSILPKMSPLKKENLVKKEKVFRKIQNLVEKFQGIGGEL